MSTLFSLHAPDATNWRPSQPPDLSRHTHVVLDLETNGIRWWEGKRPIGIGYYLPLTNESGYLPFGHKCGNNLDENRVRDWARRELRGKHIDNIHTKFDVHHLREWGVDLSTMNVTLGDVAHEVALLDDHRQRFSLEVLCEEFLPDEHKVLFVNGTKLVGQHFEDYPPELIAVRAMADCRQVHKLKELFRPRLEAEDLTRVLQLEQDLIFPVCEMEKNAAPLDVEKLRAWEKESEQRYLRALWRVSREVGFTVNPDSSKDLERLFKHLEIPITNFTASGAASFTDEVLSNIDHPAIVLIRTAGKLADIRSKYLVKYLTTMTKNGLLRYALHQLRSDEGGTVSGRFSSAAPDGPDSGANIQQVMAVEKQLAYYGDDFIIRELFIAAAGQLVIAADAMQIEYRIFSGRARNPRVMDAYRNNPRLNFHKFVWEMIKPHADLTYKELKNLNFAKIYGAGLTKLALMLGHITQEQFNQLHREYTSGVPSWHPLLKQTEAVQLIYNRELPEVQPLLRKMSDAAMERGYVQTIMGRRMRFPKKQRIHKALNGVIQGDAAEVMKTKIVELYRERKRLNLTMRMTVHDEFVGDVPDQHHGDLVGEMLDDQSFPQYQIPLLWDVHTGNNWRECKE